MSWLAGRRFRVAAVGLALVLALAVNRVVAPERTHGILLAALFVAMVGLSLFRDARTQATSQAQRPRLASTLA
jgi:hypothetical protein